jgi:hypothetical protein
MLVQLTNQNQAAVGSDAGALEIDLNLMRGRLPGPVPSPQAFTMRWLRQTKSSRMRRLFRVLASYHS